MLRPMRDLIRKRLRENRGEALESIAIAINRTKSKFSGSLTSSRCYLAINKDNEVGLAEYMDRSIHFIRRVASGSWAEYADELWDAGQKLKQEIMDKMAHDPGAKMWAEVKGQLDTALDKIIKRKVEDFELDYVEEGRGMNATTNNTVNIIGSNISHSVMQITQSGKDTIWKEIAQKLQEVVNSEEIKGLPEQTRLDVLDQAEAVIDQLNKPVTDVGKVQRGLKRLGGFISSVASKSLGEIVTQLAMKALGM